ncbi:MAG: hypothetical protein IJV20_01775 [Prevotella sp.]|nr:hypothetical protein [Prevotella sp.]
MKKTNSKSVKPTNELIILKSEEFGQVKVVSDEKAEGYFCLNDLCGILNLSKKEVIEKLLGHLYTVSAKDTQGTKHEMDFVDESGVYILFFMSKVENAIEIQEWLDEAFLNPLREQQKVQAGFNKDDVLVVENNRVRQALRYLAIADNVRKSGHFKVAKDIPELTMSHLMGWWYNPNDDSTFMIQFDCKSNCYVYQNIRMNIYLTKMEDGDMDECRMRISFLDLDDDNYEFFAIQSFMPSYVLLENGILDYIFAANFQSEDIKAPGQVDRMIILNGEMTFHRSRRV